MSENTYAHSVAFSQNEEIASSLTVNGNLKCSALFVHGDLTVTAGIIADTFLHVTGSISVGRSLQAGREIKAGKDITTGSDLLARSIEAGGSINAKGNIRALESLTAAQSITSTGAVEAANSIHCGGAITAGAWVLCAAFDIRCTELNNRLLPLGREFWATLPIFSKWSQQISDPKMPWLEIRRLANAQEARELASASFGHWSLEGQLRVFLGAQASTLAPAEAHISIPSVQFSRPIAESPAPPPPTTDSSNPLLTILLSTVKTPFPNYSTNPSYQTILQTLKKDNILSMDLRQAYSDMNINLTEIFSIVSNVTVPDAAVKAQILAELNAAGNVRLNYTNANTFINSTILADNLKIEYVGNLVTAEDDDQCSFNVLGVIESVIAGLAAIPDAGAIFTIIGAIAGVIQSGWGGGVSNINAEYAQLYGDLSTQFNKMLGVNGLVAQALLTDWGKLNQANQLIINGTLSWPADDSAAVIAAGNSYEIEVFKVLFPLHWSPIFTIFNTTGWNCTSCGPNVTWTGNGYAGPTVYWLTYGGYWWGDCHEAENELARIGVSIENLTQGTGVWGSSIWSWIRSNVAGVQQRPNCCSK